MRSRAGSMSNRSTTVPQGTLIPAVLETAFNSTGSGFARALVQRDIYGFDGARVLIPRGSRLIGEYDRKSGGEGKSVSVRVDPGGRGIIKKKREREIKR